MVSLISKKNNFKSFGFTLVELMVVIAIFLIITGVVLVNAPQFRERANLDLVAQEVSLHIRGAQVFGLGTVAGQNLDYNSYGIHFSVTESGNANPKEFYLFGSDQLVSSDSRVNSYEISGGSFEISNLCYENTFGCISADDISIIFQRPKTQAIFFIDDELCPECGLVRITLESVRENKSRDVVVSRNGQIYVDTMVVGGQ